MATQREIIYTVKTILRGGVITDDDKLSDRQIAFLIDNARAVLLRQQYDKGQLMSENNIQHLQCVPLTSADTAFDTEFPTYCRVYRTTSRIPKPIEAKGKDLIMSITSSEFGGFNYEVVPYARVAYMQYTRFPRPVALLYNGYVYLVNAPYTEQISISGIFENPNDLAAFDNCTTGGSCFDWDTTYPLSSHLIDPLTKMVIEELTLMLKVNVDKTNNANEALEPQTKTEEGGQ